MYFLTSVSKFLKIFVIKIKLKLSRNEHTVILTTF